MVVLYGLVTADDNRTFEDGGTRYVDLETTITSFQTTLPVHALVMTVAALLSLANAGTAPTHPNRNAERNPTRALAGLTGGGVGVHGFFLLCLLAVIALPWPNRGVEAGGELGAIFWLRTIASPSIF